jgi:hypothetical protein
MRTRISYYRNAHHPVWYNEKKVSEGIAIRLYAGNFLEDADRLNSRAVAERFKNLEQLNQQSDSKAFHILMSFYNGEQLSQERYITIGKEYISLIKLGRQPFVIYQHLDAGRPHLHLVVSTITPEGWKVKFDRKPGAISMEAVEHIVRKYGLRKHERIRKPQEMTPLMKEPQKIVYGTSPSSTTMMEVLAFVLPNYKYTDMNELNAVLLSYNIYANTGKPGSLLNDKRGLVYAVHDETGKFKGGRIPSNKLPSRPGRDWLDQAFAGNREKRGPDLERIRTRITLALMTRPADWPALSKALMEERIRVTPFMNSRGIVHEMAFIDHQTRTVVTGTNLGPEFSAGVILDKIGLGQPFQINEKAQKRRIELTMDARLTPADRGRALQHLQPALNPEAARLAPELKIKRKGHEFFR